MLQDVEEEDRVVEAPGTAVLEHILHGGDPHGSVADRALSGGGVGLDAVDGGAALVGEPDKPWAPVQAPTSRTLDPRCTLAKIGRRNGETSFK